MNETPTDKSAISDETEYIPCVRYGSLDGSIDYPQRSPKLHSIYQDIPEKATVAGPIYLLTPQDYEWQQGLETGYEVPGKSAAYRLQNDCEDRGRVLYPVYVESDDGKSEGLETLVEWYETFLQEWLNVEPDTCTYYYSGGRSVHVHLPWVVRDTTDLKTIKDRAQTFCETTEAKLDYGIYKRKGQFRLPGAIHRKTGTPKVAIQRDGGKEQWAKAVYESDYFQPETFADVLRSTFESQSVSEKPVAARRGRGDDGILTELGIYDSVLQLSQETRSNIATPLIERQEPKKTESERKRWRAYNAKEFSPYAHAGPGSGRSVAAVKVLDGGFARQEVRSGATLIPSYFYGAHGCLGREFTMYRTHAPLQLSTKDWDKWEAERGNDLVIIGGQNRSSRLIEVDRATAICVGHRLHPEEGSRQEALAYLEKQGYETGSGGGSTREGPAPARRQGDYDHVLPADEPTGEPSRLQQKAERKGIETLSHLERRSVALRLLTKYDWDPVWDWFKKQFGDQFKPEVTWIQLKSVVEAHPGQRTHVNVPPRP